MDRLLNIFHICLAAVTLVKDQIVLYFYKIKIVPDELRNEVNINTLRSEQNYHHFADDIFKCKLFYFDYSGTHLERPGMSH